MNLFQLRAFDAVAREGSFTRAAARLFISQPAVTGHIKTLEEHYQITLLRRTARRVELTEEGIKLAAITRAMLRRTPFSGSGWPCAATAPGGRVRIGLPLADSGVRCGACDAACMAGWAVATEAASTGAGGSASSIAGIGPCSAALRTSPKVTVPSVPVVLDRLAISTAILVTTLQ